MNDEANLEDAVISVSSVAPPEPKYFYELSPPVEKSRYRRSLLSSACASSIVDYAFMFSGRESASFAKCVSTDFDRKYGVLFSAEE